jgi:prepilin-type N-terminal cleavage/methylation domain-containing protein
MNYKYSKLKKGFSLVELMAVLAIMLIMTAVLFANNPTGRKAQTDVESAARQVASQIRSLQNDALSGRSFDISGTTQYAHNYKFTSSGTSTYSTSYEDSSAATIGSPQTFDLTKNRVSIDSASPSFYFSSPQASLSPGSTLVTITSTVDTSKIMYICVSNSGIITEQKVTTCN